MKRNDRKAIGGLIREIRKSKGMSQMGLAEMIDVSYQQIQKYEKGASAISVERLKQIARALDVPVTLFFPSARETISEAPATYGKLTDEEQFLLRFFRGLKDRRLRKAFLAFLKSLSK